MMKISIVALDADYNTSLKPVLDADEYAEEVHTGKDACTKFVDNFEAILLEDEEMNDCHRMEIRMIRYYIAAVENPVIADCPHEGINCFDNPLNGEALKSSQQKMIETLSTLFGGSLSIRSGQISFSDEFFAGPPILTEIQSLELRLSKISYGKPFPFHISGKNLHSKKEGRFSIRNDRRHPRRDGHFKRKGESRGGSKRIRGLPYSGPISHPWFP